MNATTKEVEKVGNGKW